MGKEVQEKFTDGKIEEIRVRLDEINKLIAPYKLAYVSPVNDCVGLEKNAHYMDKGTLDKLVNNVSEDGFLSQLPFGMLRADGKYLILSGNHRLKASIKAKLEYILILYVDELPKDKQIAYQLSHNSLVGKDDLKMLKEIYDEMDTIDAREFSGLNGVDFIDLDKVVTTQINDDDIELTEVKFLFVESRSKNVQCVLDILGRAKICENSHLVLGDFEAFISILTEVEKKYNIKSMTVAFSKMIDICEEHLNNLPDENKEEKKNELE